MKKKIGQGWVGRGSLGRGEGTPPPPPPRLCSLTQNPNKLIATSYLTFPRSLMKFHQVILELSRKREKKNPAGGGGGFAPH